MQGFLLILSYFCSSYEVNSKSKLTDLTHLSAPKGYFEYAKELDNFFAC